MLSDKENTLLTQTGADTPMGEMLREYWWPVLRADKLEPDGAPQRVRLMGENYVAWRATDGRLGFFDEYCPHRRVSLALARNEDCALRCIMHGWKIDVTGKVLETPNEVEAGPRLERIKVRHFPIREAGNMIWVYVGHKEAPPLPNFPFIEAHTIEPLRCEINANWIQVFETLWDPAHVQILHSQGDSFKRTWEDVDGPLGKDNGPRRTFAIGGIESRDEDYGFRYKTGQWDAGWVPTVMPCWIFISGISPEPDADRLVFAHTPVDDEHMLLWQIPYNLTKEFGMMGQVLANAVGEAKHNFRLSTMIAENIWGQDRARMKQGEFSGLGSDDGVVGLLNQDVAVAESMGAITSRSQEHLGPADHAVIKGRQYFLEAVRAHMAGKPAPGVHSDLSRVGVHEGREYDDAAAA